MNSKAINITTWVLQGLVSAMFLMAAFTKLATPFDEYVKMMPYAEDFSATSIKIIAILELLGVIGMSLPLLINKLPFFSPISALGLAGTMVGAIIVHAGRSEPIILQIVLLIVLVFVAFVRFKRLKPAS